MFLDQKFCDLHCVEGGTLADIIGYDPKVEPIFDRDVFSNPSHQGVVDAGCFRWHWIDSFIRIVHHPNPGSLKKQNPCLFSR